MEISSYGRQDRMMNFAHVSGHGQCLLFLSFDTPGGRVGVPIAYAICLEHKILNENIKSIYGTTRGLTKGNT